VPPLERLLAAQRGARIVWQHIGWDNVGAMTPALLQGLLERHPNLFLGLRVEARTTRMGGDGPMPNRLVDAQLKLLPEWQAFMARNSERLVIGADDFISPEEGPPVPSQSLNETWSILAQLPPEVARRIGGDNARRIYRLD
jgi:predicted TIM-barrel fold metal-dependent hydrolase